MAAIAGDSPRLIIRADASESIGGGHVMRCLALADAWRDAGGAATFAAAAITTALRDRVESCGYATANIAAPRGTRDDARLTVELARRRSAAAVVLDGYCFDPTYQAALHRDDFLLVMYDDEGQAPRFACDVLINQNIWATEAHYASRTGARLLAGARYASLRAEFLRLRALPRRYDMARKVVVSLGLSDTTELLLTILAALDRSVAPPLEITLLTGTGDLDRIGRAGAASRHQVRCLTSAEDFAELLQAADMAILAGGGTAHEAACLGTPIIVACIADNQRPAYREFVRRGAALDGGEAGRAGSESFTAVIDRLLGDAALRERCASIARDAVDGRGAERVVAEILALTG
jgi:UDP-2,4-diacetamido-2,4,6-trideoxy-beta-L-altropyranose hydrolase